jgi:pimeloyl-ACP methyl ester carboxylesterase
MPSRSPIHPELEERWVQVSGGRMRYRVGGVGKPLVLLHGIAASSFSFRLNWADLTRDFQVFLPELINLLGDHGVPTLDGSLRSNALRMREFLDGVGLEKAAILGSSHGGAVVMELATTSPERFDRMILVSPAGPFATRYHGILRFYQSAPGRLFIRLVPFLPGRAWDYGIGRMYADPKSMAAGTGLGYARPLRTRGAIRQIQSSLKTFAKDVEALLPKLPALSRIPTLIIWGDRDPVVEVQSGYALQQALGADLVVMQGVGHLPYEEKPDEFNQIVRNFVVS